MSSALEIIAVSLAGIAVVAAPLVAMSLGNHRFARPKHLWAVRERLPWSAGGEKHELVFIDVIHAGKEHHEDSGPLVVWTRNARICAASALRMRRNAVLSANRVPRPLAPQWDRHGSRILIDVADLPAEATFIVVEVSEAGAPLVVAVDGGGVPCESIDEVPVRERPNSNPPGYMPPVLGLMLISTWMITLASRPSGHGLWFLALLLAGLAYMIFNWLYEAWRHRYQVQPLLRLRWGNPDLAEIPVPPLRAAPGTAPPSAAS